VGTRKESGGFLYITGRVFRGIVEGKLKLADAVGISVPEGLVCYFFHCQKSNHGSTCSAQPCATAQQPKSSASKNSLLVLFDCMASWNAFTLSWISRFPFLRLYGHKKDVRSARTVLRRMVLLPEMILWLIFPTSK